MRVRRVLLYSCRCVQNCCHWDSFAACDGTNGYDWTCSNRFFNTCNSCSSSKSVSVILKIKNLHKKNKPFSWCPINEPKFFPNTCPHPPWIHFSSWPFPLQPFPARLAPFQQIFVLCESSCLAVPVVVVWARVLALVVAVLCLLKMMTPLCLGFFLRNFLNVHV